MADFLTIEDAADQLSVSEALLRQWIKRGLARATRRGGEYIMRQSEVVRLQGESANLPQLSNPGDSQEREASPIAKPPEAAATEPALVAKLELILATPETQPEESAPRPARPKVLPPRSGKDPATFSAEKDRRRRMGRRASDFTLEILHHEIKSALSAALDPLLPRLEEIQSKLNLPMATATAPSPDHSQQLSLEQRIVELEGQQQHLEEARESFRQRLEDSERERQRLEQLVARVQAQAQADAQARPAVDPALVQRLEDSERERKRLEEWAQQVQLQQAQHDDGTQQLLQRLSQEMQNERQLRLDGQDQLERLRA